MEKLFIYNCNDLTHEELVNLDGGVRDPHDVSGSDDYGINSPNGCIPNPFDKIFKPTSTF